ncbi:MAG: alpha/beta hydrolase [Clostridia bacterium]|nr:alpha/beta hydrolase [Clostridia bacterium]
MSRISDKLRAEFKASDDIRDAGLTTPPDILRRDDIVYGDDPKWQALDVYTPRAGDGPWPVIVSVHGGGWVYGDKERYQYYCMSLAQRGFGVVNFTYRLAPEHRFPAPLEDANLVFHWLRGHAAEYGLDDRHVFAVGDSAGAHLLALYACVCTNPEYAARFDFAPPAGFVPTAVALNCGVYERDVSEGAQGRSLMEDFLPGGITPESLALTNPILHVTPAFPPAFVMTSTGDYLRAQAPVMAAKLDAMDVPHVSRLYGDHDTRPGHVFHCDMRDPVGKLCNDEECDFFKRFI